MVQAPPKISVVIVTRNRAELLKKTLDRVVADGYPNREIIVVDGNSSDGTVELLRSYGDAITRWISEPDRNEAHAWNKAFKLMTGDLVKLLGDDDLLHPGALAAGARHFAEHPETEMLFGQARFIDTTTDPPRVFDEEPKLDLAALTVRNMIRRTIRVPYSLTVFARRETLLRIGDFSETYKAIDVEYFLRAAVAGVVMRITPVIVVDTLMHGENGRIKLLRALKRDLVRAALTYGKPSDVVASALTVFGAEARQHLARPFHRLGLHPRQRWNAWRERLRAA